MVFPLVDGIKRQHGRGTASLPNRNDHFKLCKSWGHGVWMVSAQHLS